MTWVANRILYLFKYIILFICLLSSQLSAKPLQDLFSLSLQELSQLQITTSSLTSNTLSNSPSSITVITQEQIKRTPARNLIDILSVYVPSLMAISDTNSSPRLRIRGLGERHNHTLLLVNGRPINQKGSQGSMVELRNWDMTDIDRVEVVRGPGSVTHGPGAISGVINIITKKAQDEAGLRVAVHTNPTYDSKGLKLSYSQDIAERKVFFHGSFTRTRGAENYDTFQTLSNGEIGYKGTDVFSGSDSFPLQSYYGDYDDEPQIKLYLDVEINDEWRFWSRYNNSGQSNPSTQRLIQGRMQDWRAFQTRYYIAGLENNFSISPSLNMKTLLSYDSEDAIETKAKQADLPNTHELNRNFAFSEDELFARSTFEFTPSATIDFATAFEYSRTSLSSPWGSSDGSFITRTGGKVFISDDSIYFGDGSGGTFKESKVAEFTSGWSSNTYSLATELKYQILPELQSIVSGRVDKNDQTDFMYSPRLAMLYQVDEKTNVKASWQKSLRMNTLIELHWLHLNNKKAEPEQNTTYEISYNRMHNDNLQFSITAYHNESEIIAWDGDNANLLGVIKAYGIEPEISYKTTSLSIGLNHSFYELIDWDFQLKQADGSALQNISYSDMLYTKDFLTLTSTGDSLNDWADQQTKLWLDYRINDHWSFHLDARVIWKYQYGNELFNMYEKAYAAVDINSLSISELADYNENLTFLASHKETVNDRDGFGRDIRLNTSITLAVDDTVVQVYVHNLGNFTQNKRQKVNFSSKTLPSLGWIEEPTSIGVKFSQMF